MDTKAPVEGKQVEVLIGEIKAYMPNVYQGIQDKAREIGGEAFRLVRRGLRGEPGCFWAMERGRVVGTPFAGHPIQDEVAMVMVKFGCAHVCMWGEVHHAK